MCDRVGNTERFKARLARAAARRDGMDLLWLWLWPSGISALAESKRWRRTTEDHEKIYTMRLVNKHPEHDLDNLYACMPLTWRRDSTDKRDDHWEKNAEMTLTNVLFFGCTELT